MKKPTVFHITHRKAGSQWIAEILRQCAPERFIPAKDQSAHFYDEPMNIGGIYPTVYVARHDFEQRLATVKHPFIKFVVIRDLRDVLVSEYFSLKISHPLLHERYHAWRNTLNRLNKEEGLLFLINETLPEYAAVQHSWRHNDAWIIKYEELLGDQFTYFEQLVDYCQIAVSRQRLHEIVCHNSFEFVTERKPGEEDIASHCRKAMVGDWRNHFTEEIANEFASKFGDVLIETGYESDLSWKQDYHKPPSILENNEKNQLLRRWFQLILYQKQEILNKEAEIQEQQRDLIAKDAKIRQLLEKRGAFEYFFQRDYFRSWLKRWLPLSWQTRLRAWRRQIQPTFGVFAQYPPRSIHVRENCRITRVVMDKKLPLVSIVTPSFNQAQFVERTINSVLQQEYPCLEYFVQDGLSIDGSRDILERYRQQLTRLESCRDTGQANAINRGIRHAAGDVMAWLNSDDILLPGALAYVADFFLTHPNVDAVYGHRIIIDEDNLEIGRWVLPPHDDEALHWVDYVPQETLFWRKQIWEKAGAYIDESFDFALDWELLLRFQAVGAKFVRLPRFLSAFRVHARQKTSLELERCGHQEMNRLRERMHGRHVSQEEVHTHIRSYLRKQAMYQWMFRISGGRWH